jgi:hypothetical protein
VESTISPGIRISKDKIVSAFEKDGSQIKDYGSQNGVT